MLDKLQKQVCRAVGSISAASLEPLVHCKNVDSVSSFCGYYFGRCIFESAELAPLPYSRGRSTRYFDRLYDFSATLPRYYKDFSVKSFFPCTATLWNSLPAECFSLAYNLNRFKSRIIRHLLSLDSF